MIGCVQWNPVYGWEGFASTGARTRKHRSAGQRLTHKATETPSFETSCMNSWTKNTSKMDVPLKGKEFAPRSWSASCSRWR